VGLHNILLLKYIKRIIYTIQRILVFENKYYKYMCMCILI